MTSRLHSSPRPGRGHPAADLAAPGVFRLHREGGSCRPGPRGLFGRSGL